MTDKLRELLEDVQTVYEGKVMVIHPNSFDKLRMEVIKLDNINKQQSEQIEKMKSQYDYAFNQLCESREIVCLMLSQYKNKKEIDYSVKEHGEKLLNQGVYKND